MNGRHAGTVITAHLICGQRGGQGVAPREEHVCRCGVAPRDLVHVGRPRVKSCTAVGGERGARERSSALSRACSASSRAKSCRIYRPQTSE